MPTRFWSFDTLRVQTEEPVWPLRPTVGARLSGARVGARQWVRGLDSDDAGASRCRQSDQSQCYLGLLRPCAGKCACYLVIDPCSLPRRGCLPRTTLGYRHHPPTQAGPPLTHTIWNEAFIAHSPPLLTHGISLKHQ